MLERILTDWFVFLSMVAIECVGTDQNGLCPRSLISFNKYKIFQLNQKLDSVLYLLNFMRFNLRYHMGCCPDTRWDFKEEQCVGKYYILLN